MKKNGVNWGELHLSGVVDKIYAQASIRPMLTQNICAFKVKTLLWKSKNYH